MSDGGRRVLRMCSGDLEESDKWSVGNLANADSEAVCSPAYAVRMRVEVNANLCQGHNRCYALAPELFDVDDYGTAVVIGDGSVTTDLVDKANLAVANCPEYAVTLVDD